MLKKSNSYKRAKDQKDKFKTAPHPGFPTDRKHKLWYCYVNQIRIL